MEKLIKNVDERSWLELRGEASRHGLKVGEFIDYLVKEHKRMEQTKRNAWECLLQGGKRLSDVEAAAMKKAVSLFESEYGFEQ